VLTVTKLGGRRGKVIGIASTERDITERKRRENALRESNDYLENLIKPRQRPDHRLGSAILHHPIQPRIRVLAGRGADTVIGKSLEDSFSASLVESSMALVKKATGGERWETVEISILHLDGSIRTVLWNSATVFAPDGKTPVATIAQGHDITERKEAEQALRASEERYRTTMMSVGDGVIATDTGGCVSS